MDNSPGSPWICHVCDYKASCGEGIACAVCYKTTCGAHLKKTPRFNADSGLFELQPVCVVCAMAPLL